MKIRTLFIPLKNNTRITPSHTVSTHSPLAFRKMNKYQAKKVCGLREKVYAKSDLDTVYSEAQEFWTPLENRLIKLAIEENPDYVPRRSTAAQDGDKLTKIRFDMFMSIRALFKAWATKNWTYVGSYSLRLNSIYLDYHRALYGDDVMYYNHKDVACTDNWIDVKERTLFGKRKAS
jgi:hypothetical protein